MQRIKDEVAERFTVELQAKNQEVQRVEKIYSDRIDNLQREKAKLESQLDLQARIE
jgi:hypothetical protein